MQFTTDKALQSKVRRASKKLGLPERELVERAVAFFIEESGDIATLYRELRAWDIASAKTMQKYGF